MHENNILNSDSIKSTYGRVSKYYNLYFGRIFHPGRKYVVGTLNLKPGERVLEVGVGTGLSLPLYPRNTQVVGIDISPDMLDKAKLLVQEEKLTNVEELFVMNAEELSFADNSFDAVIAMYVATVVPHPERLVQELKRVCKPGGRIVFLNHFHRPGTWTGWFEERLAPFSNAIGFRPDLTLEDFLKVAKLNIIDSRDINLLNLWTVLKAVNEK